MDSPIVVQKYGGTSVADPNKLGRVADRVVEAVRSGRRVVVVVSAMGKTTDELLALARTVAPSPPRRGRVVIVAGFQGMSYKREITTLGRGGSDTTAVALAAALGADCEIYSDVDGVYSADPRVVGDVQHLPFVGYGEMQELAEHGA